MRKCYIIFTLLALSSCISSEVNTIKNSDSCIVGIALNAKLGAIVSSSKEDEIYYVEGVNYWKRKYLNNKIRIVGTIVEKEQKQISDSTLMVQLMPTRKIIINPKYELVK